MSLFKHIQRDILVAVRNGELISFLNEAGLFGASVKNFQISNYMNYMSELKDKYRLTIFKEFFGTRLV